MIDTVLPTLPISFPKRATKIGRVDNTEFFRPQFHAIFSDFSGEPVNGIENRLDHCSITVSPSLNPDHESIDVPDDLLRQLAILGKVSSDGVEFSGAEMIYNYERVLRQVTYSNKKPAYYLNRQFRITCSELNGRFVSNEYVQTVSNLYLDGIS